MPLNVGSVILCQYCVRLLVCAASSMDMRRGACTTAICSDRAGKRLRCFRLYGPGRSCQTCRPTLTRATSPVRPVSVGTYFFAVVLFSADQDDFAYCAGFHYFFVGAGCFR